MNPFEILGETLRLHRQQMFDLHPALLELLDKTLHSDWIYRDSQGWSRDELLNLCHYLFHHKHCPREIQTPLNPTVLWRLEVGIPVNRRAISTYCYLLGVEWSFHLQPLEENRSQRPLQILSKPSFSLC